MKSLLVREQVDGSTVLSTKTKYIQEHSTKLLLPDLGRKMIKGVTTSAVTCKLYGIIVWNHLDDTSAPNHPYMIAQKDV